MTQEDDPVVSAMRSGAGLPVLSVLDEYLSTRAEGTSDQALASRTLETVLSEVDTWLTRSEERLLDRLTACDPGPLRATMEDHLTRSIDERRQALSEVRRRAEVGNEEAAWARLEAEFLRLHTLRGQLSHLHRASRRLAEVADLLADIPDDDDGRRALDTLAEMEAYAASHPTPEDWAEAAQDMEDHCLEHVELIRSSETTPEPDPEPAPETLEVTWDPDVPEQNGSNAHTDDGHRPKTGGHTNGHTNGHAKATGQALTQAPALEVKPEAPSQGSSALDRFLQERQPTKATATDPARQKAAGQAILDSWQDRFTGADAQALRQGYRHGPLWAAISEGTVTAPDATREELLELAKEVEIDLVEIELPRILALSTGSKPAELRASLAQRAEAITRRDPKQVARETFLEYVVGKLPATYRKSAEGLALIESIAHALAADEPWEASDHDFESIVRNMVERELDRTPAVDIEELSTSLIGQRPDALALVAEACQAVAAEDPDVQLHSDGIIVRALAEREDPDKLYKLRGTLEARLGKHRASQLIKRLVTVDDEGEQG